ncbi:MAG: hypothetical protein ACOYL7_03855 [Caldilinea sp.]
MCQSNLNLPHQYHNGGIWPMVGGFHLAALIRYGCQRQAEQLWVALAEGARQGSTHDWTFNGWLHGASGHPLGYEQAAWSAAMFLQAEARTTRFICQAAAGRSSIPARVTSFVLRRRWLRSL